MKLTELKELGEQYDHERNGPKPCNTELTQRLKSLVEKHGVSVVAAVLGLSESSVLVYTRYKNAQYGCVSQDNVVKAETILKNL